MKNIVICSDGTGNSANKGRGTNVFKLFEAVNLNGHREPYNNHPQQVAFYDDGVGTEKTRVLRILGGAFGLGLSRNVKQLYTELCRCYVPGDRIYLFGFSRGAFTVRTLAGLVVHCGIIERKESTSDRELDDLVKQAYERYRKQYRAWLPMLLDKCKRAKPASDFRHLYGVKDDVHAPNGEVPIRFMGVWDTVDAVGFPIAGMAEIWNQAVYRFKFNNNHLHPLVLQACQALAIDDQRLTFKPELWHKPDPRDDERRRETKIKSWDESDETASIEQVWFSGVHSNVGGGYPKHGMSLVALDWMMTRAEGAGLHFLSGPRELIAGQRNADDKLYDSRSGLAKYYRYQPRIISDLCAEKSTEPRIHVSVIRRISRATEGYAPGNIPANLEIVTTNPESPPVVGENHHPLSELQERIGGALERDRGVFAAAAKWVWLRQASQFGFWGLSAAVLLWVYARYGATVDGHALSSVADALPMPFGWVVNSIMTDPIVAGFLLVVAVSLYAVARLGRAKLDHIYSSFWRTVLSTPGLGEPRGRQPS